MESFGEAHPDPLHLTRFTLIDARLPTGPQTSYYCYWKWNKCHQHVYVQKPRIFNNNTWPNIIFHRLWTIYPPEQRASYPHWAEFCMCTHSFGICGQTEAHVCHWNSCNFEKKGLSSTALTSSSLFLLCQLDAWCLIKYLGECSCGCIEAPADILEAALCCTHFSVQWQ